MSPHQFLLNPSRYLLVILVLSGLPRSAGAQIAPDPVIKVRAERTAKALATRDYAVIADLTYPALVEVLGGRDKMIRTIEAGLADMDRQKLSIVDFRVDEPSPIVTAGARRFVILPTTLAMKGPGMKLTQSTYLLGISEGGAEWTFLDGSGINPEMLKMIALDLPPELTLPAKKAPVIEKTP